MPRRIHPLQRLRRALLVLVAGLPAFGLPAIDCLDHEIVKRFRETTGPGLVEGLGNAVTNPENPEEGLRQAGAAFAEGLGGIIATRTPSSMDNR